MKKIQGKVISDRMEKTAVILVERRYRHPMYGKILKRKKKIHAANVIGAKAGQLVEIAETRPVSRTTAFRITKIITNTKTEANK